jgi:1,2-phenylacetyl-CoA epoxidase catalytic subunit
MIRIALDLDDTINFWWPEYIKLFGTPKNDHEVIKNI